MLRSSPEVDAHIYPAGQVVQAVEVPAKEYVPAVQVEMPDPSVLGQTLPAGHTVHSVAPAVEKVPAGHVTATTVPASVQADPMGQVLQTPTPAPANSPGGHGMGGRLAAGHS